MEKITDYKITAAEIAAKQIEGQENPLVSDSAAVNQAKFDALPKAIAEKMNGALDKIEAVIDSASVSAEQKVDDALNAAKAYTDEQISDVQADSAAHIAEESAKMETLRAFVSDSVSEVRAEVSETVAEANADLEAIAAQQKTDLIALKDTFHAGIAALKEETAADIEAAAADVLKTAGEVRLLAEETLIPPPDRQKDENKFLQAVYTGEEITSSFSVVSLSDHLCDAEILGVLNTDTDTEPGTYSFVMDTQAVPNGIYTSLYEAMFLNACVLLFKKNYTEHSYTLCGRAKSFQVGYTYTPEEIQNNPDLAGISGCGKLVVYNTVFQENYTAADVNYIYIRLYPDLPGTDLENFLAATDKGGYNYEQDASGLYVLGEKPENELKFGNTTLSFGETLLWCRYSDDPAFEEGPVRCTPILNPPEGLAPGTVSFTISNARKMTWFDGIGYTDEKAAGALASAKTYTNTKATECLNSAKAYTNEAFKYGNEVFQMQKGIDFTAFGVTLPPAENPHMRIVVSASFFTNKLNISSPQSLKLNNYTLFIKRRDMTKYFSAKVLGYEERNDGNYVVKFEKNQYGLNNGGTGKSYYDLVTDVQFCLLSKDLEKLFHEVLSDTQGSAKAYADTKDTETLESAKSYTNTKCAEKADAIANSSGGFHGGKSAFALHGGAAIGYNTDTDDGAAIGHNASANSGGAVGRGTFVDDGGAVGCNAGAVDGFAGGKNAIAGNGVALGKDAKTKLETGKGVIDAIQLGTGTNNTPKSMQVYDFQMMDVEGNVPEARLKFAKAYTDEKLKRIAKVRVNFAEELDGAKLPGALGGISYMEFHGNNYAGVIGEDEQCMIVLTLSNDTGILAEFSVPDGFTGDDYLEFDPIGNVAISWFKDGEWHANLSDGIAEATAFLNAMAQADRIAIMDSRANYPYMDVTYYADLEASAKVYVDEKDKELKNCIYTECAKKVDKVTGKGLSQNDFTNALKAKVEGMDNLVTEKTSESLESAKTYTNTKALETLNASKTYADTKSAAVLDDAQDYADEKAAGALESSKTYADTKDAAALQSAKNYTDSAIGRERALLDNQPKITRTGEVLTGSDSIGVMEKLVISGGFHPSGEPSLEQAATVSFAEKLLIGNNGNLLHCLEIEENSPYTNGFKDCFSAADGALNAANLNTEHILEVCPSGSPSLLVSVTPFTMFKGVSYTCTYPQMENFGYPVIYMYTTNENGSVVNIEGRTTEGVGHFNRMHLILTPTEDIVVTHIRLWINNTMLISSMSNYSVPDGAFPICIYKNSVQKDIPETETTVDISELALKGACSDTKEAYDQIVVDYRNKTVKHIQRYAKYTLSENSNLSVKTLTTATSVNRWQVNINSVSETPEDSKIGFCNILPFGSGFADTVGTNYPCIMTNNLTAYFKLPVSYGTDVATVKQMLLDKGFYFWFVRKNPIETDITDTEIGQALLNLTLSKDFSIQTTGTSGRHEITYFQDLNKVLYEQNLKIAVAGFQGKDWKDVQEVVRAGIAPKVFAVGDQFAVKKGNEELVFDVIDFDKENLVDTTKKHSMTLQLHDVYKDSVAFDAPEAAWYIDEESYPQGLAAGTYHFSLPAGYDTEHGGGKTYQFTLANPVPVGGQICFNWAQNTQAADSTITTYAAVGAAAAIETVGVTEGTEGTAMPALQENNITENTNCLNRIRYGSSRWAHSDVRQWMNSAKNANLWWEAQNVFDRPPQNSLDGFLKDMDAEFLSVLAEVYKKTRKPQIDGGGIEETADKFFLLSREEVYGGAEPNTTGGEGEPYAYYGEGYSKLSAPGGTADANRIKYLNNTAQNWFLRSIYGISNSMVRTILSGGNVNCDQACIKYRIVPACVIA